MAIPTLEHVVEATRTAIGRSPNALRNMAGKMDMKPSSLGNTLNPYADRSSVKLGVEQMVFIMKETGDVTPLQLLAAEFGFALYPMDATPDKSDVRDKLLDVQEATTEYATSIRKNASAQMKIKNINRVIRELAEADTLSGGTFGHATKNGRVIIMSFAGEEQ